MDYQKLWKQVELESNGFNSNCLLKNINWNIDLSQGIIQETFSNLKKDDYSWAMRCTRMFKDYALVSNLTQKLIQESPFPDEHLSNWMTRVLGSDDHFIILANSERLNEQLATKVSELVTPLCESYNFPMMRCEAVLILGRYALTPLGIHHDQPVGDWHRVLQINLGPGKKKLHFWKRDVLQDLLQSDLKNHYVSKEKIKELIPYAKSYEIGVGEALFFSPEEYHVAESDEFSVSLGLVLFNENKKTFQENALKEYMEDMLIHSNQGATKEHAPMASIREYLEVPPATSQPLTNNDWIKQALNDYKHKYQSNQYLRMLPFRKEFEFDQIDDLMNSSIALVKPFKILHFSSDDAMDIFIRGRKFMFFKIPGLAELLDYLNEGNTINIKEVREQFDAVLEDEAILLIIQKLYESGGISIQPAMATQTA